MDSASLLTFLQSEGMKVLRHGLPTIRLWMRDIYNGGQSSVFETQVNKPGLQI